MPNPKKFVRYDELSQLLVDNGFRKDGGSDSFGLWVDDNGREFFISPNEVLIPYHFVKLSLIKANVSVSQLEFYKIKYFKSEDDSE